MKPFAPENFLAGRQLAANRAGAKVASRVQRAPFQSGRVTYLTETFVTAADVQGSFPRALALPAGFGTPVFVLAAQISASDDALSWGSGLPTWKYANGQLLILFQPGLEAFKPYTIRWRVEAV